MNSRSDLMTDFTMYAHDNNSKPIKECLHSFLTDIAESGEHPYQAADIEYLKSMVETHGEKYCVMDYLNARNLKK